MNDDHGAPRLYDGYCYWVVRMGRSMRQHMSQRLFEHGLSEGMLGVLMSVEGSALDTPSAIAGYMDVDRSAITRTLREMEQRALVTTRKDGSDGRQRRITLTDEGIALLGAGTESARLTNAHYSSTLPEGMAEDVRRHFRRILLAEQAGTAGQPLIGP